MTISRGPWGWWGQGPPEVETPTLSILHLIENNTLDAATAALLWLFAEAKASFIVASPPRLAGKSTTMNAILGLRRPKVGLVHTKGEWEDFAWLGSTEPGKTYIVCNEISNHLPMYSWGESVLKMFRAVDQGYSLASTMHADSPQEVMSDLRHPEVDVPPELLGHLALVVNLLAGRTRQGVIRRLREVWMQEPAAPRGQMSFRAIVRWQQADDSFALEVSPEAAAGIKKRLGFAGDLAAELEERRQALEGWLREGVREYEAVRRKAAEFYGGKE
ncbi:MAG: hypothetical protein HY532_09740 [Chloroflexi bacterium]|nr:hypothetical protein [Chloroflexota bacterium]